MYTKDRLSKIAPISDRTIQKLQDFVDLLCKWQQAVNLISQHTLNDIWHRHIADSMQIYPHIPKTAKTLADMGSGGGFPALILAILATDEAIGRDIHITLIESDIKKSEFLKTCIRELHLTATVFNTRIEHIHDGQFDVLTARALCDVKKLIGFMHHLNTPHGIFLKGKNAEIEIQNARQNNLAFSVTKTKSLTNSESVIVFIGI